MSNLGSCANCKRNCEWIYEDYINALNEAENRGIKYDEGGKYVQKFCLRTGAEKVAKLTIPSTFSDAAPVRHRALPAARAMDLLTATIL